MPRDFEVGVILPNFGDYVSRDGVLHVAEAAAEFGFDSIWTTEHFLVGAEAVGRFGSTLDSVTTLAWLASRVERVGLGTSVVILPLHHPVLLANEAATLQELSGGRLRLGVGVGWHEDEFRFLGVSFKDRDRRADEQLRLMKALWAGERDFEGQYWSFSDAHFGPLPKTLPELWIGGNSRRAFRRARELGDVWHPTGSDAAAIREARERWPGTIVPRVRLPEADVDSWLRAFVDAGANGLVITFGLEPAETVREMHRFAREVLPAVDMGAR